jgi:hypothetical protein
VFLVRPVLDRLTRRVRFQRYKVTVETTDAGPVLRGLLHDTVNELPRPQPTLPGTFPAVPAPKVPAGHVALVDRFGNLVGPVLPLPTTATETVHLTIVTNAAETAALMIPTAGALASDDYTFRFDLDRARYRSTTADDDSNYRASTTWQLRL